MNPSGPHFLWLSILKTEFGATQRSLGNIDSIRQKAPEFSTREKGLALIFKISSLHFFILKPCLAMQPWRCSFIWMIGILRMKITLPFSKLWLRAPATDKSRASSPWPSSRSPRAGMEISQKPSFQISKGHHLWKGSLMFTQNQRISQK